MVAANLIKHGGEWQVLQRVAFFMALFLFAVQGQLLAGEKDSDALIIYTEENPPFTFLENGAAAGLYVELVLALFDQLDIKHDRRDITVVPWARAYNETLLRKGRMLFSVVRTPEREASFKWVGPIGEYRTVLMARKANTLKLLGDTKLSALKIGVTKNSRVEDFLIAAGTPQKNLVYLNSPQSAAHMLARGRIDAWARDFAVADWTIRELGYSSEDYEVIHAFETEYRYIGFSKATDDTLIDKLQHKLDSFREDGTLAAITQTKSNAHAETQPHIVEN